ncbi:MAG: DUF2309 family protein, partial [Flavobacteriales bacterium]|nr:DUF2309 family protein [Flavobacteriales bacterium]
QMIEVHDPVRLLVIVEHLPEIVLEAISASPEVYQWYGNHWVHIMAFHPAEHRFYYFSGGTFKPYANNNVRVPAMKDPEAHFESSKKMPSNHIADATFENLSVHFINSDDE